MSRTTKVKFLPNAYHVLVSLQVQESLNEVARDTLANEPGALIYKSWKAEGKDEFVCVEK